MKLLLDQGLGRVAALLLRNAGHDTVHVGELGMAGAADELILALARRDQRVLATFDVDFHTLLALSNAAGPSVIRLHMEGLSAAAQAACIMDAVEHLGPELARGCMVVVDHNGVRCRVLPISEV